MLERHIQRALLLLILAVGVFLRVYHLDRIPLGLRFDEAFNGVDALRILGGERPVFLTGNYGREPLFIYLQALSVSLLGNTDLALRLVAAMFGTLTLPLAYVLTRRLFGSRIALLAVAWLAICLWHVLFSRIGLRTISLPLSCTATFYCLWRGLEVAWGVRPNLRSVHAWILPAKRSAWFLVAGLLLGATQYTYTAARFAPIVILAFATYLFLIHRPLFRAAWSGLVLTGIASLVSFMPLGLFFLAHPDTFTERASQLSILDPDINFGSPLAGLAHATLKALAMFSVAGDPNWDRNVPSLPVFGLFSSAFFVAGLVIAIRRARQPGYAFTLLWIVVMLGPGFLAVSDAPNFLHVTGVIPAIFILPALSGAWLWDQFEQRVTRAWRLLPIAVTSVAFLVGASLTYQSYFGTWAHSKEVAFLWGSDRWLTVATARATAEVDGGPVLAAAGDPDGPLQRFAVADPAVASRISVFDSQRSLIFLPGSGTASYLFPASAVPPPDLLQRFFPGQSGEVIASDLAGDEVVRYRLGESDVSLRPERAVPAHLGTSVELLGFDLARDVHAGSTLSIRWYWHIIGTDHRDLAAFNQLYDAHGQRRGQLDGHAFLPDFWPVGTAGISTFEVPVSPDTPTGGYTLLVGAYDRQSMMRLMVSDPSGQPVGDQLELGPIKVHGGSTPPMTIAQPRNVHLQDQIDFRGDQVDVSRARTEGIVETTLYWSARSRPTRDYTVFVHLLDAQGKLVAQGDAPPQGGRYPTSIWDADETIADAHRLKVAGALVPGAYQLEVGLYRPDSGQRLSVIDEPGRPVADRILIPAVFVP